MWCVLVLSALIEAPARDPAELLDGARCTSTLSDSAPAKAAATEDVMQERGGWEGKARGDERREGGCTRKLSCKNKTCRQFQSPACADLQLVLAVFPMPSHAVAPVIGPILFSSRQQIHHKKQDLRTGRSMRFRQMQRMEMVSLALCSSLREQESESAREHKERASEQERERAQCKATGGDERAQESEKSREGNRAQEVVWA